MKFKKLCSMILILVLALTFVGCDRQLEIYNEKDNNDFQYGAVVKFNIVQFKNVIDEKTLKEMNLSGSFFMFLGSVSAQSKETTDVSNTYYMYLKNKNDAIYFAKIPADKVRIYEDANTPCIVGWYDLDNLINVNDENKWEKYNGFNLHIPKGTIIPRVNFDIDINNIKNK